MVMKCLVFLSFCVVVWFAMAEIIIPLFKGTNTFPMFDGRRKKAERRIQAARELREQIALEAKADEIEQSIKEGSEKQ